MSTIATIAADVLVKVENRSAAADLTRAYVWVQNALDALSACSDLRSDFSELEVIGPAFNLTIGTQEYAESNWLTGTDINNATLTMRLWTDPTANTRYIGLDPTDYQRVDRVSMPNNQPSLFYRYGGKLGFDCPPNAAYQTQARYLRYHPLSTPVQNTTLLTPRDMDQLVVWAATIEGWMELEQFEKATQVKLLLYGDPVDPKQPGLIKSYKTRHQKEEARVSRPLRVRVRRYSY